MKIPPFKITPFILTKTQAISKELGKIDGQKLSNISFKLRRSNNIKTIQASLAIEGNSLSLNQVTDIFEGKRVLGPAKDILEAKNALELYDQIQEFDPLKPKDMLKAHNVLMNGLINDHGNWRSGAVGIFKGKEVSHVAPPAKKVPELMENLFNFIAKNKDYSWLLKACIFHYELEFIHPFADGNGRMGRLWQQLLLMKEDKVFEYIPVEVIIKNNQKRYYEVLGESDALGESTPFIEFALEVIHEALIEYSKTTLPESQDALFRLNEAREQLGKKWFSRKEYLLFHKTISTATASRDLLLGVEKGILNKEPRKNQTSYKFLLIEQ